MKLHSKQRVIALDVHPKSVGYVAFEGADELLDWGVKSSVHGGRAVKIPLSVKFGSVLDDYLPDAVVIKATAAGRRTMVPAIAKLARSRKIPVKLISRESIAHVFLDSNKNKYRIATVIAARFPELAPRLKPRRKKWEAEKFYMGIFDAAAAGIAYFARKTTRASSPLPR